MAGETSAQLLTYKFSFCYVTILISICFLCLNKASEINRPLGVSISKASLYIPDKDFTCFDGSNVIPFSQINDDYCDCADGSDEPGTAACPNSFFHCTNAGYRPRNIPSSQVNDGICDCCDGADEYAGKRYCENSCQELGRAERHAAVKRAEIAKAGNEARIEASKKGKQIKQEKKEKLDQLDKDKQEAETIRAEKEYVKLQAEEAEKAVLELYKKQEDTERENLLEEEKLLNEEEARDAFNGIDTNGDNKIDVAEVQNQEKFDQNKDGVVSEDEAKYFLEYNDDMDFETFLQIGWPRYKPLLMLDKGLFTPPAEGSDVDVGVGTVEDVTGEYQEERQSAKEDLGEGDDLAEGDEDEDEEEEPEGDEEQIAQEPEPKTDQPQYDAQTQAIINAAQQARTDLDEADRQVRDIQRDISQLREYLDKDFGPEEEFAPLEGECFDYTDREYIYKLCPFDQASQRPRSGGSETRLGTWRSWNGPRENKYNSMMYDRGQSCWNGPQRSTLVYVSCGIENALTGVSEPNKCEYQFEFTTPSACRVPEGVDEKQHDEL